MENKNYSEKLEKILSDFSNKDKKLSKEEKMRYSLDYQKIWLAFAKENDFEQQTIEYLYQSKRISENNLLLAYIKKYDISAEQLMKILKSLLLFKKYRDRWFNISLETLSMCLNEKTWGAKYIKPFVLYLPEFLTKKNHEKSVTKYMLEILHAEVDLTLIDSCSGSVSTKAFCESIYGCLKDINENALNENALQNYKKLNEYIVSVLSEKSVSSSTVLNDKDELSKIDTLGKKKPNQDISDLSADLNNPQKESIGDVNKSFTDCAEAKIVQLQEAVRILNVEKVELEKKYKTMQTKLNEKSMSEEYANNTLTEEREHSSRLLNQLKEEQKIKEFYKAETKQLKKQEEINKQELLLRDKRIKDLEEYIDVIKSESQYALQGSLNSIGLKLKREYTKFSEYLEAKASGKETFIEEDLKYLEYLLDRVFIVLKRNGVNIK